MKNQNNTIVKDISLENKYFEHQFLASDKPTKIKVIISCLKNTKPGQTVDVFVY